jgi:transglutaminase-like putative cysteine protease
MDFSAWYEVFLDRRWFTLDARNNHPRIGRIVVAKGRDAAECRYLDGLWFSPVGAFQPDNRGS